MMDNKERNSFIKNIIEIFNKNQLGSIEFKDGDLEIKLKKNISEKVISRPQLENPEFLNHMITTPVSSELSAVNANQEVKENKDYFSHPGAVKSPTVGVIYTRPSPNEKLYIDVGSKVKEGDTLFLLEVMKVFNPIKAHKSGTIKEIFVKENNIVEFDEVLAIIE